MKPVEFVGFVDDAGHFALDDRDEFLKAARSFSGYEVTVTLAKRDRSITNQQRRWLRGGFLDQVVAYLIEHCGNEPETIDRESLHYDFLSIRFGTKAVTSLTGGTVIVPARRSSDLNSHEVSDYMEWLVRYCAKEMGLTIELPDEWRFRNQVAAAS